MDVRGEMLEAFDTFYESYIVELTDQSIQVFQSFTYGEMTIAALLLLILMVMAFKWLWEVLR